jgi:hypothetical protein
MSEYKQPVNIPTPNISFDVDPNTMKAGDLDKCCGTPRVSMGDPGRNKVKTDGMKQRGSGAATKGFTSRGPMA